ncbi:amino acid adenylation domain-containing protein [Ileibacterium valens]|uniref:amino acid adenylation domain-containing protein n=1 Tax=Ileibacterium valens TaxID=1862668 RepID=UPI0024B90740|nr:amino acid adenylation domain-containing protein [Ileibacterium valens]
MNKDKWTKGEIEENTVYGLFKKTVSSYPKQSALIDSSQTFTYEQLESIVCEIAASLPQQKQRFGIILDHGYRQIASMLAVLKNASAYVPAEPFLPDRRIQYMFSESKVRYVLTQKKYRKRIEKMGFLPILIDELSFRLKIDDTLLTTENYALPLDLAYILYTSGSTGKPKGVMVTNSNICHYIRAFRHEFHPGLNDRMLQYSVCSFDIFTEEVFTTLCSGACLVIAPESIKDDIEELMKFVKKHQITEIDSFPYLFLKMNDLPEIPDCIRLLISGGDVIRESYIDKLVNDKDHPMIYNTYGPSETTICASYFHIRPHTALSNGTYPIGHSVLDTQIELVNKDGQLCQIGEPGEILIYGDGVSAGYSGNRPKESLAFFMDHLNRKGYRSGDLGYWMEDGNLAFIGRKDEQVMIDGRRVEPQEVQNTISELDYIYQACVRAETDENNLPYLIAYVVFKDQIDKPLSKLRKDCALSLPDYMIPEFFIKMESPPLNINGKIDQTALPVVLKEGKSE